MNDVPAENVFVMMDEVEEFGEYSNKLKLWEKKKQKGVHFT